MRASGVRNLGSNPSTPTKHDTTACWDLKTEADWAEVRLKIISAENDFKKSQHPDKSQNTTLGSVFIMGWGLKVRAD